MALVLALIILYLTTSIGPRLMVETVALTAGILLVVRSRRAARALIYIAAATSGRIDFDRKPSRAERRLMRRALRLALDQTEFRSLLPTVAIRVGKLVDHWERKRV